MQKLSIVERFSRAYEAANAEDQAALRAWMRGVILPGNLRRKDLARCRRAEKDSIEARDRCILKFPASMSPNAIAKVLRAEGWYSKKTTVYYIEHRIRRLREKARAAAKKR